MGHEREECTMSRVALGVASPSLDVDVEPKLAQSPYLLLVNPDTMDWESLANPCKESKEEGGVAAAQCLVDQQVSDVVSGYFEPSHRAALRAVGIVPHRCECGTSVVGAIERLKAGELPEDFWR
jgi:predicted Fe-Mo cluster-binding NifX family protein